MNLTQKELVKLLEIIKESYIFTNISDCGHSSYEIILDKDEKDFIESIKLKLD